MKRQVPRHGENKHRMPAPAIMGPLMGLAYIILLPLIGVFAIFLLCVEKVVRELKGDYNA